MVRLTKNIDECVNSIKEGNIIVFPTETVYGMGADIFNEIAVNKKYLSEEQRQLLASTNITILPPWDPMGSLACL